MQNETSGYAVENALYYEMAGAGETIVLVHAAIANRTMWDSQWQALTNHYRVVRYDMRGFGKSADGGETSTHCHDLAQLFSELEIGQAHLIGCSMGGEVALDFALQYPAKVSSLVLVSATPSGFAMEGEPPTAVYTMIGALQSGNLAEAARAQNEMSVIGENRDAAAVDAGVREAIYAMTVEAFQRGSGLAERGDTIDPVATTRLAEVSAPTLPIVGAADNAELHRAAQVLENGIPHARKTVVVENAAHLPNMEQPAIFNQAVLDFLASL